ncbi:uncharacterized protein LOC122850919 [Aphidius gifuensis]|uniref:uncharacterized protein LOC122850919 n=1 Tax=Aphidius gifuensis TaxID=684658 RepID=UPI001CDBCAA3|nr:uncharacterized protein LOC122850919 [Aphidius gifuensis]
MHKVPHPNRVTSYERYKNDLNLDRITFPMSWCKIKQFEKNNNLKINVYGIDNTDDLHDESNDEGGDSFDDSNGTNKKKKICQRRIIPYYLGNNDASNHPTIHLLIIEKPAKKLMDSKMNQQMKKKKKIMKIMMNMILIILQIKENLVNSRTITLHTLKIYLDLKKSIDSHNTACREKNQYAMKMPTEKNNIFKFKNYKYQLRVPYVVYADLESILEKVTDNSNNSLKKTIKQKHIPNSVAYYGKCSYDNTLSTFKLKRDKNCIEWFIKELEELSHKIDNILENIKPMNLTFDEELQFFNATKCHICKKLFTAENIKARDHCHLSGVYRGPAHVAYV